MNIPKINNQNHLTDLINFSLPKYVEDNVSLNILKNNDNSLKLSFSDRLKIQSTKIFFEFLSSHTDNYLIYLDFIYSIIGNTIYNINVLEKDEQILFVKNRSIHVEQYFSNLFLAFPKITQDYNHLIENFKGYDSGFEIIIICKSLIRFNQIYELLKNSLKYSINDVRQGLLPINTTDYRLLTYDHKLRLNPMAQKLIDDFLSLTNETNNFLTYDLVEQIYELFPDPSLTIIELEKNINLKHKTEIIKITKLMYTTYEFLLNYYNKFMMFTGLADNDIEYLSKIYMCFMNVKNFYEKIEKKYKSFYPNVTQSFDGTFSTIKFKISFLITDRTENVKNIGFIQSEQLNNMKEKILKEIENTDIEQKKIYFVGCSQNIVDIKSNLTIDNISIEKKQDIFIEKSNITQTTEIVFSDELSELYIFAQNFKKQLVSDKVEHYDLFKVKLNFALINSLIDNTNIVSIPADILNISIKMYSDVTRKNINSNVTKYISNFMYHDKLLLKTYSTDYLLEYLNATLFDNYPEPWINTEYKNCLMELFFYNLEKNISDNVSDHEQFNVLSNLTYMTEYENINTQNYLIASAQLSKQSSNYRNLNNLATYINTTNQLLFTDNQDDFIINSINTNRQNFNLPNIENINEFIDMYKSFLNTVMSICVMLSIVHTIKIEKNKELTGGGSNELKLNDKVISNQFVTNHTNRKIKSISNSIFNFDNNFKLNMVKTFTAKDIENIIKNKNISQTDKIQKISDILTLAKNNNANDFNPNDLGGYVLPNQNLNTNVFNKFK